MENMKLSIYQSNLTLKSLSCPLDPLDLSLETNWSKYTISDTLQLDILRFLQL